MLYYDNHYITFKAGGRYDITQKVPLLSCSGSGKWFIKDGKIILGPNDSNCETTRNIAGTYSYSDFKK